MERLYLSKTEAGDVYVDIDQLPQHQIDGIRFLYKQYKKKRPGVVINHPPGYGKALQIVLFLSAVKKLMDKPILILCSEEYTRKWASHFNKSREFRDDVSIGSSNPFIKKAVHINTAQNLPIFCRREWSALVVHGCAPRDVRKVSVKAEYKIWVTCIDFTIDLNTFLPIYQWLYPKEKLNIDDFVAKNRKDSVAKAIRLEAFLEDIVLRRSNYAVPIQKREHPIEAVEETPSKVSRKNKDATGTKIKRTKRSESNATVINIARSNNDDTAERIIAADISISNDKCTSNGNDSKPSIDASIDKEINGNNDVYEMKTNELSLNNNILNSTVNSQYSYNSNNQKSDKHVEIDDIKAIDENDEDNIQNPESIVQNTEAFTSGLESVAQNLGTVIQRSKSFTQESESVLSDTQNCEFAVQNTETVQHSGSIAENNSLKINQDVLALHNVKDVNNTNNKIKINNLKIEETKESKNSIDSKLLELEERALKKFKGSVLDNLF